MIEEYYISEDTLVILPVGKNKTKIHDVSGVYYIKKTPYQVIEDSCQYYGSSYGGRYIGAKRLLEMDYKLPIIIDEVKEVIVFPTRSPKHVNCSWVCVNNIENYEKYNGHPIVKFINNFKNCMDISYNSLENQIMRSTLLMVKLKKRKSNPKKIGK